MTHDLNLPPEQQRVCYPGNNASCIKMRLGFATDFVLYLVLVFGMLFTVLGNFIVIVSVCHFKQLHKPTNVFISSLALADLLVGVLVMPFNAVRTVHGCWYFGDTFCQLHASFEIFLTILSIFHLMCIAVDRYQAICNPLHYSRRVTMSVAVIMVCVIWTLIAVYAFGVFQSKAHLIGIEELVEAIKCPGGCFLVYTRKFSVFNIVFSFIFPCITLVCLYTHIFIVAQRHVRKIGNKNNCSNDKGRGGLVKQSEHKAAKTLSIVLCAFLFCWMPFYLKLLFRISTSTLVGAILLWLGYFNSALNPIIYALFYPCFKKCFHCIITLKIFSSNSSTMNLSVK